MAVEFKHVMLMVKDVMATVKFYSEGLGLTVKMASPGWAELDANGTTIALHAASQSSVGSSPILSFHVSPILSFHVDDVHTAISSLETLGASMEGEVREPSFRQSCRHADSRRASVEPVATCQRACRRWAWALNPKGFC